MSLVSDLKPLNLAEEKGEFFHNTSYNPQFVYRRPFASHELSYYGLPNTQALILAQKILGEAFAEKNENDLFSMEGKSLTQDEVTSRTSQYLAEQNLGGDLQIKWTIDTVSRTTTNLRGITFRPPCSFKEEGFVGMLYHEIGTHLLRGINDEKQSWHHRKKQLGFSDYLRTEEGLAVLHGQLAHSNKLLYIQAIRLLAVAFAQNHSFAETWGFLDPYVQNVERRWVICTRVKRGLCDTALPGGFTKDILYFEGALMVFQWLQENNYDLAPLYFGKIALADVEKAKQLSPGFTPHLPSFFTVSQAQYRLSIEAIAKANHFTDVKISD